MRSRKALALILTIAMVFGSFSMVAADTAATEAGFADMLDNWSTAALNKAVDNGLLKGYTDGDQTLIKADNPLTRAELAAVVNRAFASTSEADISKVTDVAGTAWYAGDMAKAVKMGTFALDTKMRPDDKITRQEAFAVLARAFKLTGADADYKALDKFTDKADIATWALKDLDGLATAGYVQGNSGKLNPKANITRAEFAVVMDNLVKQYIDEAGTVTEVVASGNVMVRAAGVTLKDVTIKGDLIIADGVGDGDVTLDSVTVVGRTVVRGGGENSIRIIGNSNVQNIIIARVDGQVRVYAEDGTEIGIVVVDGSDDVIIEGDFASVTVLAEGVTVAATKATIANAAIEGENSNIVVGSGSTINNLAVNGANATVTANAGARVNNVVINANGATVAGGGTVTNVTANADNAAVNTTGTVVKAAEGTTGVTAGGNAVAPGTEGKVESEPSTDRGSKTIAVSAITVTGTGSATTVVNGSTLQMIAAVTPDNATNKTVTWSVTNGTGSATIDASTGLLTAAGVGTVTVKATNAASGVFGTKDITIVAPLITDITVENREDALEAGQPSQENDGKFDATIAAGAAANEYEVTFTVDGVLQSVEGEAPYEGKWMGVCITLDGITDITTVQYSANGTDWTALEADEAILSANRAKSFMYYLDADVAPTTRYIKDANGTVYTLVFDVEYEGLISTITVENREDALEAGQPSQENDGKFDATIAAGAAANEYEVTFTVDGVLQSVEGEAPYEGKWMGVCITLDGITDITTVQYSANGTDWTALEADEAILSANRAKSFMYYLDADVAPTTRYIKDANGTVYTLVFDVEYEGLISTITVENREDALEAGQPSQENDGKFDATIAAGAAANEYEVTFTVDGVLQSVEGEAPYEGKWMGVCITLDGITDITTVQYSANGTDWTALEADEAILSANRAKSFMYYLDADVAPTTRYIKDANGTVYTLVFDVEYEGLISTITVENREDALEAGQPSQENDGKFDATIAAGAAANEYEVTFTVDGVLQSVEGEAPYEGKWMGVCITLDGITDITTVQYSANGTDWTALEADEAILSANRAKSFMYYLDADVAPTTRYIKDANGTVYTLVFDVEYEGLISTITVENREDALEAGQPSQENDGKFDATIAAGAAANEYEVTFTVDGVLQSVEGEAPYEGKWMGVCITLDGIADIAAVQYSADKTTWTALEADEAIREANRANSFMYYLNADAAPTTRYLKDANGTVYTLVFDVEYEGLISTITVENREDALEAGQPSQENDGKFDATIAAGAAANEYEVTFTVDGVLQSVEGEAPYEGKWMGVCITLDGITDITTVQYSANGTDWTALEADEAILSANRAKSFMYYLDADVAPTTRYIKDANGTVYTLVFDVEYEGLISTITVENREDALEAGQPSQENDGKFDATIAAGAAANEYEVTFTVDGVLQSVEGEAPYEGKWMGVCITLDGIADIAAVQYSADKTTWTALEADEAIREANRANSFMYYLNADAAPTTRYLKDANGTVYTLVSDVEYEAASYNGPVTGQITADGSGLVNGALNFKGTNDLVIVGQVTGTGNLTTFEGTVSGSIVGTIVAQMNANGIDTLSGVITPSGVVVDGTVRIIGIFGQTGIDGDFEGEIITGPIPTYVESMEITSVAGPTVAVGDTLQLGVNVTPGEASDEVAWSVYVNDREKGSIDENGLFTATAEGTVTVIAKALDGSLKDDTYVVTVQTLETEAIAAINAGEATLQDYENAGIIGLSAGNLTDVNTAVATAKATKGSDLIKEEIQGVVASVVDAADQLLLARVNASQLRITLENGAVDTIGDMLTEYFGLDAIGESLTETISLFWFDNYDYQHKFTFASLDAVVSALSAVETEYAKIIATFQGTEGGYATNVEAVESYIASAARLAATSSSPGRTVADEIVELAPMYGAGIIDNNNLITADYEVMMNGIKSSEIDTLAEFLGAFQVVLVPSEQ